MTNNVETITVERRSDQWNADDFALGSRIFTIAGVRHGKAEAKYDIDLVEGEGRCWRPPNTVLQLLLEVWGTKNAADWVGRRVELYRDAEVSMGREKVGGIRVRAVSHIDRPTSALIQVSRGKRKTFTVQPLPDTAPTVDPGKVVDAIAAIHKAPNITELVRIETYANGLGIGNDKGVQAALALKRAELEVIE